MYSHYLVLLLCLVLPLSTIQGEKVMQFEVIDNTKRNSATNYMLGKGRITKRAARVEMQSAYLLIRKEIYNKEDPFRKKGIKEITLELTDEKTGTDQFVVSKDGISVGKDYFKKPDSVNTDKSLKKDFQRKIYFAMTILFLKTDGIEISNELKNGLADFILLEGNLAEDNWAKPGEGEKWSERSDITAQFLHYCQMASHGFVSSMVNDYKIYEKRLEGDLKLWWDKYKASFKKA